MNITEYQNQLERLRKEFGKPFGEERSQLLWAEVKNFSDGWFKETISLKLRYSEKMPLPCHFDDDIAQEKERQRQMERHKEKSGSNWEKSRHSDADHAFMFSELIEIIKQKKTADQVDSFISMVDPREAKCIQCDDRNVYFNQQRGGMVVCNHQAKINAKSTTFLVHKI
jgi:hypothetical protein